MPEGTKVNGIDLGHYSCDVFMNDRMKQQMLSGEQVTIGFKADEPVQVWTGKQGDEQHPYKRFGGQALGFGQGRPARQTTSSRQTRPQSARRPRSRACPSRMQPSRHGMPLLLWKAMPRRMTARSPVKQKGGSGR